YIISKLFILGLIMYFLFQPRNPNSPPCVSSWIPWFGAAFQFGKAPLEFLEQARIKHGPVFTVYILGNRLTFVAETEDALELLRTKEADFDEAVMQAIQRTVSISKESFHRNRSRIFKLIVRQLSPSNLHQFSETLWDEFHEHVDHLGKEGTEDLNELVRFVMFPTIMKTLFGKSFGPTNKSRTEEFERHFQNFDDEFEFGSQMPEFFLRKWSKSKTWLLTEFERIVTDIKKEGQLISRTALQAALDAADTAARTTATAIVMRRASWLHSAGAFWTLAFILSHPSIYKNIMEEIVSVYGKAGNKIEVFEDDLRKLPSIKQCILEALRLTSPGVIMRKAMKPIKVQNFVIPPGDLLLVSPYWMHRNPKYFPEPEIFKPVSCFFCLHFLRLLC
uniref:Cytochrome P450 n=1 Tax=Pelusios castaneus TaxID=367368 RepID=A0A8C8RT06_9SAUR